MIIPSAESATAYPNRSFDDSPLISWPSWFQFKEDQYVLGGEDVDGLEEDEGISLGVEDGHSDGEGD
eukprot:CAMPEP_0201627064 /NCGR_PEP_ID=MMETSP0493-20130528/2250_1 /ASSEMBLY_ACC=CAM_ASM_000838 /TAXON_ID=420259 /ORGANISM="Thalassiosira gravida, Strain GMp14c1" /LENGTH=66 /DNA_ID=CAMNT_0048097301 /DNA_START=90 /DNA_END=287 /DNA_ORIENTATION=-